jgi:hypothetical protein
VILEELKHGIWNVYRLGYKLVTNFRQNPSLWFYPMIVVPLLFFFGLTYVAGRHERHERSVPPAERLALAKSACGPSFPETACMDPNRAYDNLRRIPESAKEHAEAVKLDASMRARAVVDQDEKRHQSYEQMERNMNESAHDNFLCNTSTDKRPIVSFDNGNHWWYDDGRCAPRLQETTDEKAKLYSYWSTKVRVDTDMDLSWLPDEERTCRTVPDGTGRVATVTCDPSRQHVTRNIPVEFWGGVDRNTVSNWKCRREKSLLSDSFICKAID